VGCPILLTAKFLIPIEITKSRREGCPKYFMLFDLHSCKILKIKPTLVHYSFLYVYFTIIYMIRVTMCPSSGEVTVSMRHLIFVTLCR